MYRMQLCTKLTHTHTLVTRGLLQSLIAIWFWEQVSLVCLLIKYIYIYTFYFTMYSSLYVSRTMYGVHYSTLYGDTCRLILILIQVKYSLWIYLRL